MDLTEDQAAALDELRGGLVPRGGCLRLLIPTLAEARAARAELRPDELFDVLIVPPERPEPDLTGGCDSDGCRLEEDHDGKHSTSLPPCDDCPAPSSIRRFEGPDGKRRCAACEDRREAAARTGRRRRG